MYQASVPVFKRMLANVGAMLEKAERYAQQRKIDPVALLTARLAPDMYPLTKQVQVASDMAKGCAARLAGVDAPKFEDNEATFADLQARIAKTTAFLDTLKPAQIDGSEEKAIVLQFPSQTFNFTGLDYLQGFGTPNVYFHVSMIYAILRHNGLDIGKGDYIGGR
jgi:hypothetical protein